MTATTTLPDLREMRKNLLTIGALQIALLVFVLLAGFLLGDGLASRQGRALAWVAVLPLLFGGAAVWFYKRVEAAAAQGAYTKQTAADLSRKTWRAFGMGVAVWIAVLLVIMLV